VLVLHQTCHRLAQSQTLGGPPFGPTTCKFVAPFELFKTCSRENVEGRPQQTGWPSLSLAGARLARSQLEFFLRLKLKLFSNFQPDKTTRRASLADLCWPLILIPRLELRINSKARLNDDQSTWVARQPQSLGFQLQTANCNLQTAKRKLQTSFPVGPQSS